MTAWGSIEIVNPTDTLPQWLSWLVTYKDLLQSLSWVVASFGGFFAAMMAVRQLRQTRLWKKTELAKKMLEVIWADDKCEAAMVLVDWSGREFALNRGTRVRIARDASSPLTHWPRSWVGFT